MAWSAARVQRRGREWRSGRELALERERWAVRINDDRGERLLLPDLAVWLPAVDAPFGVVAEPGYRRADRQLRILEGWREAIYAGRYAGVRYDAADELTARRITTLATKAGLDATVFEAAVQSPAEIATIETDALNDGVGLTKPMERPAEHTEPAVEHTERPVEHTEPAVEHTEPPVQDRPPHQLAGSRSPVELGSLPHRVTDLEADPPETPPSPEAPNAADSRAWRLRQLLGNRRHR